MTYKRRNNRNNSKNYRKRKQQHFAGTVTSSGSSVSSLITPKAISQARKDIGDWKKAQQMAKLIENPKWYLLQQLYDNILNDALLTSQIGNRNLTALSKKPVLFKPDGKIDEEQTDKIQKAYVTNSINKYILQSRDKRISLVELNIEEDDKISVTLIPRENLDPEGGFLYPDYSEDKKINYRELKEYGTWILEFGEKGDLGLLNKAVPHVLFKRFAQSCYSELCEIYGIPPRVMKTNTQDPTAMARGKRMMQDMGSAAYFIIDDDESFEFAQGVSTNGDVYKNLINLCNNENSLLFSGAIIGQDTKNGSRSKDESAKEMLDALIESDLQLISLNWNSTVLPALKQIGFIKGDVTYGYMPEDDIEQLWKITNGLLPYKNVDDQWLIEKFGVQVTGDRTTPSGESKLKLNAEGFFV